MRKNPAFLDSLFAQTSIDAADAAKWLHQQPNLLSVMLDLTDSRFALEVADQVDFVDFHFRRYLCGLSPDLRFVYVEVGLLCKLDQPDGAKLISAFLAEIERHLIDEEWFELLPRFTDARKKIGNRIRHATRNAEQR